jgi:ribonuclease HI
MKQVQVITDGACLGNPGPGGWATILRYGNHKKEIYGSSPHTTNNRMELAAAIEGLRALREPCEVVVVTDSEYLKRGITEWIQGWKRRGWRKVMNVDLWKALDLLATQHRATWTWTKGHARHSDNNRADELASTAARDQVVSPGYRPDPELPDYRLDPSEPVRDGGLFTASLE